MNVSPFISHGPLRFFFLLAIVNSAAVFHVCVFVWVPVFSSFGWGVNLPPRSLGCKVHRLWSTWVEPVHLDHGDSRLELTRFASCKALLCFTLILVLIPEITHGASFAWWRLIGVDGNPSSASYIHRLKPKTGSHRCCHSCLWWKQSFTALPDGWFWFQSPRSQSPCHCFVCPLSAETEHEH